MVHNFWSLRALWVRRFQDAKFELSCSKDGSSNFLELWGSLLCMVVLLDVGVEVLLDAGVVVLILGSNRDVICLAQ